MLRSFLRLAGALAFVALIAPLTPSAAPAPGIAYDEIVRVVMSATPPPPGNFQNDLSSVNSAATAATPAPTRKRGIGLGAIAGAVLGGGGAGTIGGAVAGDAISNAMEDSMQRSLGAQFATLGASIRNFLAPHVLHYAYYNGWERIDDVALQTATIRKCEMGQVYHLDLAKKTYTVYDPASEPTPAAAPPARSSRSRESSGAAQPPGTAIADVSATTKALGQLKVENVPTSGYDSTAAFAMTQATGSCRNGSASITTAEYLSAVNRPSVTSCPIHRAPIPESANEAVAPPETANGGCKPTLTFHHSGPPIPAGKLSLYTLVTLSGISGATPAPTATQIPGIGFLTERGNLKAIGATDTAQFSVPADFSKTP